MRLLWIVLALLSVHATAAFSGENAAVEFGAEVNGLRTQVTLVKTPISVGQPVEIRYTLRNVSKADLVIWHSGFWPNHQILVKDAAGSDAVLTALGKQCKAAFSPGGARDKNFPVTLKPGSDDTSEGDVDLTRFFDLSKPGVYSVQLVYEEKQSGWSGRCASNVASFEITK